MCGIVAIYSRTRPVSPSSLRAAAHALAHRGPDDQGYWLSPGGQVGLGHTRLSINDPQASQPIASNDGRLQIVVNGEFYDYKTIRRHLQARGHIFSTRSDSEIALHLYADERERCLYQLRGEFAFVIWDETNQSLFAARDRFGIKPFFYTDDGDRLLIASEAKALFAAGVPSAWDEESVFQSMFATIRPDRSLFAGIRQLPAGHFMVVTADSCRIIRYWDVEYPRVFLKPALPNERETVEEVRQLLNEAVRLRMEADVPVGCLLSGGLDSSTLLGVATEHVAKPLQAFTISFEDSRYDETVSACESARWSKAEIDIIPATAVDLADCLSEAAWHGESIQYNAHGTARFLLSRAIREAGYKAVLAGEGADELFAGYAFVRKALEGGSSRIVPFERLGAGLRLLQTQDEYLQSIGGISPWLARFCQFAAFPQSITMMAAELLDTVGSLLDPDFINRFRSHDPYWHLFGRSSVLGKLLGREPAKQIIYLWLRTVFVNYHMAADRLDMAHGVEVRLPYLDHILFERASQIPVSLLAKDGVQKYVLREAASPYVSANVYARKKQPFFAPPLCVEPGNKLYEATQEILRGPCLGSLPFINQEAVRSLLDRAALFEPKHRALLDPLVMVLVSMSLLQEQFLL